MMILVVIPGADPGSSINAVDSGSRVEDAHQGAGMTTILKIINFKQAPVVLALRDNQCPDVYMPNGWPRVLEVCAG